MRERGTSFAKELGVFFVGMLSDTLVEDMPLPDETTSVKSTARTILPAVRNVPGRPEKAKLKRARADEKRVTKEKWTDAVSASKASCDSLAVRNPLWDPKKWIPRGSVSGSAEENVLRFKERLGGRFTQLAIYARWVNDRIHRKKRIWLEDLSEAATIAIDASRCCFDAKVTDAILKVALDELLEPIRVHEEAAVLRNRRVGVIPLPSWSSVSLPQMRRSPNEIEEKPCVPREALREALGK